MCFAKCDICMNHACMLFMCFTHYLSEYCEETQFRHRMQILLFYLVLYLIKVSKLETLEYGQCTVENREKCKEEAPYEANIYKEESNVIYYKVQSALKDYTPCAADTDDASCDCHAEVITADLQPYEKDGVTRQMLTLAAKYGTRYKILQHRLYRDADCMFPARCLGIEHFLLNLLPELPDMDLVVNTRDWPQLRATFGGTRGPVFSFSKSNEYLDIMYPAWTFWAGGPAISLHPTGIGRWDLLRKSISQSAEKIPWTDKRPIGFFRGSRTSDERDSLVLLSRRKPDLVDAQYTKNQAWKSPKDTLNAEPAKEVSFEHHCKYKYLFNFRGVAASFRLKHLFLCKSLVFHVGDEWNEFFYFALKPWVHYVPLKNYPSEHELEKILQFFKEHDDLAREIAERGREFIWQHLRMTDVECYWKKLLTRYQKLLKFTVTEDRELIEIKTRN